MDTLTFCHAGEIAGASEHLAFRLEPFHISYGDEEICIEGVPMWVDLDNGNRYIPNEISMYLDRWVHDRMEQHARQRAKGET